MDYACKFLIRGIFKCLKKTFKKSDFGVGFHDWSNQKLLERIRLFINDYLPELENPTDREVQTLTYLIYPNRFPKIKNHIYEIAVQFRLITVEKSEELQKKGKVQKKGMNNVFTEDIDEDIMKF